MCAARLLFVYTKIIPPLYTIPLVVDTEVFYTLLPDYILVELVPDLVWFVNSTPPSSSSSDPINNHPLPNSSPHPHRPPYHQQKDPHTFKDDAPSMIWTTFIVAIIHFLFEIAR